MWKRIVAYGTAAVLGIVCAVGFFSVFTIIRVTGTGMEPAYEAGSHVLVHKLAYHKKMPQIGDVVAIRHQVYSEDGEDSILIRRVAGHPGDRIEIRNNVFYRNVKPCPSSAKTMPEDVVMEDFYPRTLGKGEVFLLCDDRRSFMDSRNEAIGILTVEDCIGKVCMP